MTYVTGVVSSSASSVPAIGVNDTEIEAETPAVETHAYLRSLPRWQKCRDVMLGTEAIRAGGATYLPQHPNESNDRYAVRKVIAALFNGYSRTVMAVVGLLLDQPPTLGEDMTQGLKDIWENVDGAGTHGNVFAKLLAKNAVVDGVAGILTEYPRANDPRIDRSRASLAATEALRTGAQLDASDEKAMGMRAYFILVKADEYLLPIYETVNGQRTLVMLILRLTSQERFGKFGVRNVRRYRVYRRDGGRVTYEGWVERADGVVAQDEGPTELKNMSRIPWAPLVCGDELSPNEYKPALIDLADLNIEHHNIKTGILSLQDLACVPTPVRVGASQDSAGNYPPLVLGPSNTIEAPATQGVTTPVYWLSPPVDVLAPASRTLESTKQEMGAMGASFLAPQPQNPETATAERLDASAEQASISSFSQALKDCLETSFGYAGEYMRMKPGSVTLGAELTGEGINPQYLAVIVQAYQEGGVSLEELRYVLQTGQLPEDFDAADTVELLAQQAAKEAEAAIQIKEAAAAPPAPAAIPAKVAGRRIRVLSRDDAGRASEIEEIA